MAGEAAGRIAPCAGRIGLPGTLARANHFGQCRMTSVADAEPGAILPRCRGGRARPGSTLVAEAGPWLSLALRRSAPLNTRSNAGMAGVASGPNR